MSFKRIIYQFWLYIYIYIYTHIHICVLYIHIHISDKPVTISTGVPRGHPSFLLFVFDVEEKIILLAFTDWCHVWKRISFSDCGYILLSRVVISQWSGHLMCIWWLPLSCLLITLTHLPLESAQTGGVQGSCFPASRASQKPLIWEQSQNAYAIGLKS